MPFHHGYIDVCLIFTGLGASEPVANANLAHPKQPAADMFDRMQRA